MSDAPPDPADLQRHMWTIGDYPTIAKHLHPISVDVVDTVDPRPGETLLDVAVGDGNSAILAAHRGALVTGIDLTPVQIDRARARCVAEGVEVGLHLGDAQALDVEDASYDVVISVMGVIFAPDYAAATSELARVCRPGGRIAMTAWTGAGWSVAWRAAIADMAMPITGPHPDEWGDPAVAAQRMAGAGLDASVVERPFTWSFPSAEAGLATLTSAAGPFVVFMEAMRAAGKEEEATERLLEALRSSNEATDGTCRLSAPYLLVTATR
jgi:SAM-dependent methyltransferase